jgi:hypothetical protein
MQFFCRTADHAVDSVRKTVHLDKPNKISEVAFYIGRPQGSNELPGGDKRLIATQSVILGTGAASNIETEGRALETSLLLTNNFQEGSITASSTSRIGILSRTG